MMNHTTEVKACAWGEHRKSFITLR